MSNIDQVTPDIIQANITANSGRVPLPKRRALKDGLTGQDIQKALRDELPETLKALNSLRTPTHDRASVDMSLAEYVHQKYGFTLDDKENPNYFYEGLGINPQDHTIHSLMSEPDFDKSFQWLVPEVIREAIRLGLNIAPIYPSLIASEESVSMKEVTMPHINEPATGLRYYDEAQTIQRGDVSFGQRTVRVRKIGTGLNISDEVLQYVKLNLLSLYLQQTGTSIDRGLTSLALDSLINGDNSAVVMSAPVVGVRDTNAGLTYRDLLRVSSRMSRLGKNPTQYVSNEEMMLDISELPEIKGYSGETTQVRVNNRLAPVATMNYHVHSAVSSDNQLLIVDPRTALVKLNVQPMRIESERIASRQLSGTYVTMTTGFAKLFKDSAVIIDDSLAYASNGFPDYMDPTDIENSLFTY